MADQLSCSTEQFTIALRGEPSDSPTLDCESIAWVGKPFICTGKTPSPNKTVWIELNKALGDEEFDGSRTVSDADGNYSTTITFKEFGYKKIHAEVEQLGYNATSQTYSVWVLDWVMLLLIMGVLLFLLWMVLKDRKKKGGKK